ncbi:hypothetical protein [Haemophilus haemolyticus]|uniref:hypothetical protein n=1 Tax=Haemophilus haemolyticus TaxID=726 RepID=UPI00128FDB79|nr:hypothetical protein [Haemophilus haemolyticus]
MKYNKFLTSCVLEKSNFQLGVLSHVHCCFSTMIYNNTDNKENYENILPFGYLVLDFDKLEINYSSINKETTNKSLDFGFVISEKSEECVSKIAGYMVLGDLKLNKLSAKNPYKDLVEKFTCTERHVKLLDIKLSEDIYIVYPENLLSEVNEITKSNLNRLKQEENPDYAKLNKFKFVTIEYIKKEFFN